MKKGIEYLVVPQGVTGSPQEYAVGTIKDRRWYEMGKSSATAEFDGNERAEILAGSWAKIEGLMLIRESDGSRFDLIPMV